MYFTINEMRGYIEEVLAGKHLEKEGSFYLMSLLPCQLYNWREQMREMHLSMPLGEQKTK